VAHQIVAGIVKRISTDRLRALRNEVEIGSVAELLRLIAPSRRQRRRFTCPLCRRHHTTLASRSNLARCFPCGRSFNPIELVMAARGCGFLDALRYLESLK
jgi:hypothetical protein